MKLDIGCGMKDYGTEHSLKLSKEYLRVDNDSKVCPDIIANAEKLPFKDSSIDEIACFHTLEHLDNEINALREFNRVLKNKALAKIIVPYPCPQACMGSVHKHLFGAQYFGMFWSGFPHKYFDFSFSKIKIRYAFNKRGILLGNHIIERLANKWNFLYTDTILSIFPCQELQIEMIK